MKNIGSIYLSIYLSIYISIYLSRKVTDVCFKNPIGLLLEFLTEYDIILKLISTTFLLLEVHQLSPYYL